MTHEGLETTEEEVRGSAGPLRPPSAYLFRVLEWEHLDAPPARFRLSGLQEVELGRGPERRAELLAGSKLRLQLADRWTSTVHARLLDPAAWRVEDAGSKNGTWVNGEAVETHKLRDGDVLEVGHALYLFREALPWAQPPVLEASALKPAAPGLATLHPLLAEQLERLPALASSSVPVILQGETGTGKEVLANALHALSGRAGQLTAVNCAALPRTLVESELFGYRKGAFSGATEDRTGLVRSADKGTLLLDEIGDLPLEVQGTLLRVLQEGEVMPVGATKPVKVDVRVIAASHRDLADLVSRNLFRADLLARLSGFVLKLPPLRERREDLGLLVWALLQRIAPGRKLSLEGEAARALLRYSWPLNVRELEKCLAAAVAFTQGEKIALSGLPEAVASALRAETPPEPDSDERRAKLLRLLQEHAGNVTAVAQALDLSRMQVHRWIRRYGIDAGAFRR